MKAMPGIAILSLAGLAACAGTDNKTAYTAPATVDGDGVVTTKTVQDARYIAEVERIARTRGVRVHWIHPPVRRVAGDD